MATITSNSCYPCLRTETEDGSTKSRRFFFYYDDPEPDLQRSGAKGQESQFPYVHLSWVGWFEHTQAVPRFEVQQSESWPGEEHNMCKTVFTQYDQQEDWCTEQKDVWLDWVKTFSHRPIRCLIIVHPYLSTQRRTELLAKSVHLSRAKLYVNVPCSPSDPYKDKRATLNKKQENETSNSETFATETNQASRNMLTNAISHGQKKLYTMISAIETSKKVVGYYLILEKNALQLIDDFATKLKNEVVLDDRERHIFYTFLLRMTIRRNLSWRVHSRRFCKRIRAKTTK